MIVLSDYAPLLLIIIPLSALFQWAAVRNTPERSVTEEQCIPNASMVAFKKKMRISEL